jgi:hypothetical protein
MSTTEAEELGRVWAQVKGWALHLQIALARRILNAVDAERSADPVTRGDPVSALIGLGAGSGEPPSDDQVKQWIDEHRLRKYGP